MSGNRPTYLRNDKYTGKKYFRGMKRLRRIMARIFPALFAEMFRARGSREKYFHFLLGYLLPIVHAQAIYRFDNFLVLDCGPLMTPILKETLQRLEFQFEIVSPDQIEERFYVDAFDYVKGSSETIYSASERVKSVWRDYVCTQHDCTFSANLLIERSAPHKYYDKNGGSEKKGSGYGTSRRSITNWTEVCETLDKRGIDYGLYEPGRHSLGCQIATFCRARRIVGIRGAEWANIVWSQPDLHVRVVDPSPPATTLTNLLNHLNVNYEFIISEKNHTPVNPLVVARFLSES